MHELFHFYFNSMKYITKDKKRYNSPMPKDGSDYAKKIYKGPKYSPALQDYFKYLHDEFRNAEPIS